MSSPMVFDVDLQIMDDTPGFQYNGQEADAQWHEDREITGVMYRATNATYNLLGDGLWTQHNTSFPSYCMTHNTDGSIGYLNMPSGQTVGWAAAAWQSTDIQEYYAVNYGLDPSDSGVGNTSALNIAVSDIISAGGGILRLPAGKFQLSDAVTIDLSGATAGLIIAGFSARTRLVQNNNGASIFEISNNDGSSAIVIKDLTLQYNPINPVGVVAAVNLLQCQNVYCERVYFQDCPTSFQTDNRCVQCGLFECTIDYDLKTGGDAPTPVGDETMVILNGSMDFVTGCVIRQQPFNGMPNGPTGCTGIALTGNNNGRFITDTHLTDLSIGIALSDADLVGVYCSDVLINAYTTAVTIAATIDSGMINDIHFTGCTFAASHYTPGKTSGVTISTGGGPSINVSGIYFSNCSVYGFGAAGIEIDSGQNVVISGGQYSSNGQLPPDGEAYLAAGITVLGGEDITITGVDCSGVNGAWSLAVSGAPAQPYGIGVAGDVSDVLIVGCNLTDNGTNGFYLFELAAATPGKVYVRDCDATGYSAWNVAINIASTATLVQVTDCPGYNDSQTSAMHTTLPTGVFSASDYGYYGPASFYFIATGLSGSATAIAINGITTGLKTGAFFLAAGQNAEITTTGMPVVSFSMIGQ
jgi:hypothetical protein